MLSNARRGEDRVTDAGPYEYDVYMSEGFSIWAYGGVPIFLATMFVIWLVFLRNADSDFNAEMREQYKFINDFHGLLDEIERDLRSR